MTVKLLDQKRLVEMVARCQISISMLMNLMNEDFALSEAGPALGGTSLIERAEVVLECSTSLLADAVVRYGRT